MERVVGTEKRIETMKKRCAVRERKDGQMDRNSWKLQYEEEKNGRS